MQTHTDYVFKDWLRDGIKRHALKHNKIHKEDGAIYLPAISIIKYYCRLLKKELTCTSYGCYCFDSKISYRINRNNDNTIKSVLIYAIKNDIKNNLFIIEI